MDFLENHNKTDYEEQIRQENLGEKSQTPRLAIIEQECKSNDCDSNKCYYTARQIRSADEGETIFYNCVKCGLRFTLNN